ncbi:WD domain, G-beta repeat, putative [Leishmania lindenbergi]|uniref:WD domain, G-beta repeat n=1 Tax=Leishmania lindenbergi TaxID=651832 RepID=A0AAW3AMG7_9TRYP
MSSASAYGVDGQARSLCPLYHPSLNSQEFHRFLIGTANLSAENKIHLIEYQDATKSLECAAVWPHNDPVMGLWCSPSLSADSLLAVSSLQQLEIFRISENVMSEPMCIVTVRKRYSLVLWDLDGLQSEFKAVHQNTLATISLSSSKLGLETVSYTSSEGSIRCAALAPYDPTLCLISCDNGLQLIDLRSKKASSFAATKYSHGFGYSTAVDFDRLKPGQFLSAGTDGYVYIHDIRYNTSCSLAMLQHMKAHEHTVQGCQFNSFRDELVLSCSSDQTLKLWDLEQNNEPKCLRRLADYGDSVVALCWSSNSPWVFAGLSFNGKLLVDTVPNEKKMSILLDEKKWSEA